MQTWAGYAEQGRQALQDGDFDTLDRLIDANFDLRGKLYNISAGNLELIQLARSVGASANFAGSGGAVAGVYRGPEMFQKLQEVFAPYQIAVIQPQIVPKKTR
jgi:glucuronokinase